MLPRPFLKEEHGMFRRSLKQFLEKEAAPYIEEWEANKEIPRSFWKKVGEQGFLCPQVDEKYGGLNADFGYAVVLSEEFDRISVGMVGFGLHKDIVILYIEELGSEEQKELWLSVSISGDLISAIAITEQGIGSAVATVR